MKTDIATLYIFRSSSSERLYHTLQYVDGSTSCDCPGWTKRIQGNGERTCRHVREVHAGIADKTCNQAVRYAPLQGQPAPGPSLQPKQFAPLGAVKAQVRRRVFDLEEGAV